MKTYKHILTIILTLVFILSVSINSFAASKILSNGKTIPVLTYHDFSYDIQSDFDKIYKVTPTDFEKQILALKKQGYTFIDDYDIYNYYYKKVALPKKPILITVDDGYVANYTHIFPILQKHNVKASVYLITASLDGKEFLSEEMIKEMADSGLVSFQMHTHDHHKFIEGANGYGAALTTKLPAETHDEYWQRLYTDLLKNKQTIERITGKTPVSITYPFGASNGTVESVLQFIGINIGFDGFNQANNKNTINTLKLKRHNIEHNVSPSYLINRIK